MTRKTLYWQDPLFKLLRSMAPLTPEQRRVLLIFVADLLKAHVRAELARLARQVRKNKKNLQENNVVFCVSGDPRDMILSERCAGGIDALNDVLDFIKQAKQ